MAKVCRLRLLTLQQCLIKAQLCLEEDPDDAGAQMNVKIPDEALLTFCAAQANWAELVMQSRWVTEGDRGIKLFYKSFKSLATVKNIYELLDPEGNVKTSWEDMADLTTKFFSSSTLGSVPGIEGQSIDPGLMDEVLRVQSDKLTAEENLALNAPLMVEELGDSVGALANGKCPGPDDTPLKYFKANWMTLGPLVLTSILK